MSISLHSVFRENTVSIHADQRTISALVIHLWMSAALAAEQTVAAHWP